MTTAIPQQHASTRNRIDIRAQVMVRTKNKLRILRERIDNLFGIATRHHHIGERLYGSSGIHITDHLVTRMFVLEFFKILSLTRVSQ